MSADRGSRPLPKGDIETRGNDDRGPDPGPQIGEIAKDRIAQNCRADQLDIAEWCDDGRRSGLKGTDNEVVPGAAEEPEAGEQRDVERASRHHEHKGQRCGHDERESSAVKMMPIAASS